MNQVLKKMNPEDIPQEGNPEEDKVEADQEEKVGKTVLEKEKSRFQRAIDILVILQAESIENEFQSVEMTYTDLEFLLATVRLAHTRADILKQISAGVNKKSDEIATLLEKISKGLPKIQIT